jgi:hypothetical protein
MNNDLQYPIGTYIKASNFSPALLQEWIIDLEELPARLSDLVVHLSEAQLNTRYRPEGWTVRQLVHHIADSHHHSYTRFKWTLTENSPVIKAYDEKNWSSLFDAETAPIELSLLYLKALHAKLVYLLKGLSDSDLQKTYIHPDDPKNPVSVSENIAKYAWHGKHHLAHIQGLIDREGW